ncbi:MAG: DUF3987 domain-containing protein [Deltaproteobacteria bacterium]|nr:DUF3987 domain-containing protein [Deltaproteobacteria bacterium]MBL7202823.1 DUF3987 domain-containing protein [Desulfobacteraceae bacterium]
MTKITIQKADTKSFLSALWPSAEDGFLSLFTIDSQKKTITKFFNVAQLDSIVSAVERLAVSRDMYYCISLLKVRPEKGRGTEDDVIAIPGLWADIDCREGSHNKKNLPSKEEALSFLKELPFKPSLIVWSGGGLHVYWLFKEPLYFHSEADRQQAKELSSRFQLTIISMAKAHGWNLDNTADLVRLLRVPGTFNFKRDPVEVKILEVNDFRYEPDSFEDFLIDEPQQEPQGACPDVGSVTNLPFSVKQLIKNGAEKGERSEAIGSVLTALIKVRVTEDEIIRIFEENPIGEKYMEKGRGRVKWLKDEIGRVREFVGSSVHVWEDPILLDDFSLPEMEPLPGILGEFSQAISTATETPLELAQGLTLAAVATACQGKIMVQVKRGYSEPVNVWVNVALESGNRKSSVHVEVTRPLLTWEAEKREEIEPILKEAESQRRNQEARIKSLRARYGKAKRDELEEIEEEIRELEAELVEVPVMPKVWVQDVTVEHLGTLMSLHGGRMSILASEGGIFDLMAGRYSNGIPNLDLFLQGHSGDPVRVDRGSRESIYLERPVLSMGLSPQPDVLKSIADSPGFRGRGLLARNLYLLPVSRLGHRTLETEPVQRLVKDRYEAMIHALLRLEPATDEKGQPVPHIISLTYTAYEEWLEFSRWVEKDLREGGRFEHIMDWAGKLPGAAARLAGLLHCVQHPEQPWSGQIELETMQQGLGLASIFSSHALKVFDLMGADKSLEGSRKVWRWIERGRFRSFKKRDCYNALKGSFPRVADIEPPLDVLEERNYVTSTKEKTGGRPTVTYRVHPELAERW